MQITYKMNKTLQTQIESEALPLSFPEREHYLNLAGSYLTNECPLYKKIKCEECKVGCKEK